MRRLILRIVRRLLYAGAAVAVLWLLFGRVAPPPISDDLASLEPERCSPSYVTRAFTAIVPMNVGSPTKSLDTEQIALISEYKPDKRRQLWVLRMPAAFVMQRPCDFGRQNWVGEGDYARVSQIFGLGFILIDDRIVPPTRASDAERKNGIPVFVQLKNVVVNPDRLHTINAKKSYVLGRRTAPVCAEQPSAISGLVTFKRISPQVKSPMDCQGQYFSAGVYARKVADRSYDVVIGCVVRCEMESDHQGWLIHYAFDRPQLEKWQIMHDQVKQFLAEHTFHLDRAS